MADEIEVVLMQRPLWVKRNLASKSQLLYWVDIMATVSHLRSGTRKDRPLTWDIVGTVVPRKSGRRHAGLCSTALASLDLTTEKLSMIGNPESHLPDNRFKTTAMRSRRTLLGGKHYLRTDTPGAGSLYRLDANLPSTDGRRDYLFEWIAWSLDIAPSIYIDPDGVECRCVRLR